MFCFIEKANILFHSLLSYYEAVEVLDAQYSCMAIDLPSYDQIYSFISDMPSQDSIRIDMQGIDDCTFDISNRGLWEEEYSGFLSKLEENDNIAIKIHIDKRICDGYRRSVYDFERFADYLTKCTLKQLLVMFSNLLGQSNHFLRFDVLDMSANIFTKYIAFCNPETIWPICDDERDVDLKKCREACVFLHCFDYPLLPQDFCVVCGEHEKIIPIFRLLENLLSLIYIANTSHIVDDKVVLQFGTNNSFCYKLDSLGVNKNICSIFQWVYGGDTAVERAAIARNIILIYCKTSEQIKDIDDNMLASIKSNYLIYQKDNTEQYINMKNQISTFIVDITKQQQEMTTDLMGSLRNNFIAIVTFFISVIFTEAINIEDLSSTYFTVKVLYISYVLIAASLLYWIITIVVKNAKWSLVSNGYSQLKENYKDILDEKDIERAFHNDESFNNAEKRVKTCTCWVSIVWLVFIIVLVILVEALNPNPIFKRLEMLIQTPNTQYIDETIQATPIPDVTQCNAVDPILCTLPTWIVYGENFFEGLIKDLPSRIIMPYYSGETCTYVEIYT